MKVTVTLAVRCLHSTQEPVMEILSLTTSTILAQDSKNWPICMERNQILTTRWRHPLRLPHCHRSRGVRKFWISRQKLLNNFGGKFIMSCFNEKKKNPIAFVCMFSESTLLHIYHVRFDRNYNCYYFPFLYKKKTPSSWSKISNYIRKIYFRLRFNVEQQKWLAMCLSNDLC